MAIDYTTIEEVVNDFQLMIDDTSYDKEAQIYQLRLLALQGLRELTFDVEQVVKTSTITVNSSLQFSLPDDYVKMVRIGYKSSFEDGFVSLGYKSNLTLDSSVAAEVGNDNYDENNPYYHTDVGRKFGVGGGNNVLGYYRINRNDNTINFSSDLSGKTVFLEYISDGITSTPARDHVVRFSMFESIKSAANSGNDLSEFGIKTGTTFKIPSRDGGSITYTFQSTTETSFEDLTSNPSNTNVYLPLGIGDSNTANSSAVANALTNVINEGHPSYHIGPNDSNIKASNIDNVITVTISNLTSAPKDLLDVDGTFDSNVYNSSNPSSFSVLTQELIQLGSAGDVPKIHKFCEEALRCYMYYKYIQRKRGIPANEKQMAKRAYYNEKRLARARMMNFNKETAMLTSRKAFKQSPKI